MPIVLRKRQGLAYNWQCRTGGDLAWLMVCFSSRMHYLSFSTCVMICPAISFIFSNVIVLLYVSL